MREWQKSSLVRYVRSHNVNITVFKIAFKFIFLFLCTVDVDFEKDIVLCEVPFGGVLFINNLIPHRRFVYLFSFVR